MKKLPWSEKNALFWLHNNGGDGVITKVRGIHPNFAVKRVIALGEVGPHILTTFIRLRDKEMVYFDGSRVKISRKGLDYVAKKGIRRESVWGL